MAFVLATAFAPIVENYEIASTGSLAPTSSALQALRIPPKNSQATLASCCVISPKP